MRLLCLALSLIALGCETLPDAPNPGRDTGDASPPSDAAASRDVLATPPPVVCIGEPQTPLEYGRCVLYGALAGRPSAVRVTVRVTDALEDPMRFARQGITLGEGEGSFAIVREGDVVSVIGRDPVGAMYGAMELAERVRRDGPTALAVTGSVVQSPRVPLRAANHFLVLPTRDERDWWFHDRTFWTEYLDLMARARLNVLDLHGMEDLDTTLFPNALLYFATSASHPEVGVAASERARNLASLRALIAMARVRGIRVSLMTYRADLDPRARDVRTDPAVQRRYHREAAEQLARQVPDLWRFGFRIGESVQVTEWFNDTLVAGLRASGTNVGIYTRTWGTRRSEIEAIQRAAGGDLVVEAKYNGEQLGVPYLASGGYWNTRWRNYSYEDYLDAPPPFRFVFQLRSGGTHRVFREASYRYFQRLMPTTVFAGASGFTLEFPHAFFPQRDYLHAEGDRYSPWTFRRDELMFLLAGRLAYDPRTPEAVFRHALRERVGTDALWDPMQAASEIVPAMLASVGCSPDQRSEATELEWHGSVGYWAEPPAPRDGPPEERAGADYMGPYDPFSYASPWESAQGLVRGVDDTRVGPRDVARAMLRNAARARAAAAVAIEPRNAEARDVQRECIALADLGEYHAHKLLAATAVAVYRRTGAQPWMAFARDEVTASTAAWRALVADTAYVRPFVDNFRASWLFGTSHFHWRNVLPLVEGDRARLDAIERAVTERAPSPPSLERWRDGARNTGPRVTRWDISPATSGAHTRTVTVSFASEQAPEARVVVLYKPISALVEWARVEMVRAGATYTATLPMTGNGLMTSIEVSDPARGVAMRWPDAAAETPYRTIEP